MNRRFISLCASLVVLQGIAFGQADQGQDTTGSAATRQLTQADLDDLEQKIQQRFDTAFQTLNEKIDGLAHRATSPNDDLEAVRPVPDSQTSRITALEDEVKRLKDTIHDMGAQQGEQGTILNQLASRNETGGYHWRFDTNSQPARTEFNRALTSTVPEKADFLIRNRTNHDEWVVVNGEQHLVLAGAELPLKVAPGTVITRLRHQQQPLAMYVGFPKYFQSVDIKERPATQVVSRPVYWVAAY
jgi:hypothetical protein